MNFRNYYRLLDACERIRESQVFLQYLLFPVVIKMNCYKNFLEFWNELFALPTFQRSFTEFGFLRILKISNLMNFLALQTFILLPSSFRSKLFMNFRNCESNDEVFVLRSLFLCFKKKKKRKGSLHDKIANTEEIFLHVENYSFEEWTCEHNERVKIVKRYTSEEYLAPCYSLFHVDMFFAGAEEI